VHKGDEMKELTESTESDIQYGKMTILNVIRDQKLVQIKRNYPEKYCSCGKQILVKRNLCYKTKRYVFPSEKRFAQVQTCGDTKCKYETKYKRIKEKRDMKNKVTTGKDRSITGLRVPTKVRKVTLYRSSCNY